MLVHPLYELFSFFIYFFLIPSNNLPFPHLPFLHLTFGSAHMSFARHKNQFFQLIIPVLHMFPLSQNKSVPKVCSGWQSIARLKKQSVLKLFPQKKGFHRKVQRPHQLQEKFFKKQTAHLPPLAAVEGVVI